MTVERLKEILAEIPNDYEVMDIRDNEEVKVRCVLAYKDKEVYLSYVNPDCIHLEDATIYREG